MRFPNEKSPAAVVTENALWHSSKGEAPAISCVAVGGGFGDDTDNQGTYSDRVTYGLRRAGTREAVNWYRGAEARGDDPSTNPAGRNDANYAADQTTSYDPSADPDNPPADGAGSRHNYTAIGQSA